MVLCIEENKEGFVIGYISKRLAWLLVCLLSVVTLVFLMVRVVPGDAARVLAGRSADPQTVEMIRQKLGLDKPLFQQYVQYLKDLGRLDFGRSQITRAPIIEEIKRYFPPTFELVSLSLLLTTFMGVGLGVWSAIRKDGPADNLIRVITMSGVSMPIFWLAILLQIVFASIFRVLPVEGRLAIELAISEPIRHITGLYLVDSILTGNWAAFSDSLKHLLLPAFCISYGELAVVARMTRASMLEVLNENYVRTARAAGFHERTVIFKYALRNALLPIVTVLGLSYGFLLGGSVLVESIFSWPGLGRYVVNSIFARDMPAIIAVVILLAFIVMLLNLMVDILYIAIDPRITYS